MNHRQAWDLIPWYVNGSLGDGQEPLQRHLAQCAACRAELEAQRTLHGAMQTRSQVENMPHQSLQKLMARIDAQPAPLAAAPAVGFRAPRVVGWLVAVVLVQALLLGVLAIDLLRAPRASAAPFRTVTTPAAVPGMPSVRAVFSPEMTLGELQALLERTHLRIVNGPSPDGVYTLATVSGADDPKQALLALRAHPAVQFAEPLGPGTQ